MQQTNTTLGQTQVHDGTRHTDVLIIGGGISGLAIAAWLRCNGADAVVLDKNEQPGGIIGTIRQEGFIFERGPNTILDKHESFDELVAWAGLEEETVRVPLRTQQRHVWLNGRLHEVPTDPLAFLKTPLLPASAKLALLREPFVPPVFEDETVAEFVRRRLSSLWLRNLVTPMVSGIWAGNPEKMSVAHSFPLMKELERDRGSLLRGALRQKKNMRKDDGLRSRRRVKNLVTFKDGLQSLPSALAAKLGEYYHPATRVIRVEPLDSGFWLLAESEGDEQIWLARELIIAADARHAAECVDGFDHELAVSLRSFHYNRLAVVSLGIEVSAAQLPAGFGFLVPRGEGLRILGAIVSTNFFPGRARAGRAALSIFMGGDLDPGAVELSDDALLDAVRQDLKTAVEWNGQIKSVHIERWPRGIPQYDMQHGERLKKIDAAEARWPGLQLAGNWRGGPAIGERIEYAKKLAGEITAKMKRERA